MFRILCKIIFPTIRSLLPMFKTNLLITTAWSKKIHVFSHSDNGCIKTPNFANC